jgi:hypothetical protein
MRAISNLSLEAGISTFWCRAEAALRIRASMSATGSVSLMVFLLLISPVFFGSHSLFLVTEEPAAIMVSPDLSG